MKGANTRQKHENWLRNMEIERTTTGEKKHTRTHHVSFSDLLIMVETDEMNERIYKWKKIYMNQQSSGMFERVSAHIFDELKISRFVELEVDKDWKLNVWLVNDIRHRSKLQIVCARARLSIVIIQ